MKKEAKLKKEATGLVSLGLCLMLVIVTGVSNPAQGQGAEYPTPAACPLGALCVYEDDEFEGRRYQFFGTNHSWARWGINNDDQSAFNNGRTGLAVTVYDWNGWRGDRWYCLRRGHGVKWLPDNYGSSNKWLRHCPRRR